MSVMQPGVKRARPTRLKGVDCCTTGEAAAEAKVVGAGRKVNRLARHC